MKHIKSLTTVIMLLLLPFSIMNAQTSKEKVHLADLPTIYLTHDVSLHFISPEPIQFVDLSSNHIEGDLPSEQIARIKLNEKTTAQKKVIVTDSLSTYTMNQIPKHFNNGDYLGVITLVGQSFMAQYKLIYQSYTTHYISSNIQIQAEDMQPLEASQMRRSAHELKQFCKNIKQIHLRKPMRKVNQLKLQMSLNNVYVMDDYIFVDLSISNKTNLSFDIDEIKFSIEDKKIYKATNNQSIPLLPVFQNHHQKGFKKQYRNIFVFKKFSFPNSKVLKIRLIENQISGRTIEMKVKYSEVLNADTF